MLECNRSMKKKMALISRIILLALPLICVGLLLSQTVFAKNTYLINDGGKVVLHTTYATDPAVVLTEIGVELGEDDTFTTQAGDGVSEITIRRCQNITVLHGGKTIQTTGYGETVGDLLARLELVLAKQDFVSESLDANTYDGMVITISKAVEVQQTYTTVIPYDTVYCYDATLEEGEEVVLTPGVDGQLLCSATVFYLGDREVGRTINSQVVTRQPVSCIVAVGTYTEQAEPLPMPTEPKPTEPKPTEPKPTQPKPTAPPSKPSTDTGMPVEGDGFITTSSGEVLTYTKKLSCVATAYSCNGEVGYTYSGTVARVGAIAVDPRFIPLGTRMYIVTNDGQYIYGVATAEDTGGAIKGNKIDLYFNTFDECWIFGVRDCTVYILD